MSGHYLPLATIAWGLALNYTMANMEPGQVRRPAGRARRSPCSAWRLNDGRAMYMLIWALALAAALAALHLLDSRPGRAIRALKSGSTMAEAMGISTFRYKLTAFVLAAMLACHLGLAVAHFQRTVNPSPFGINKGIEYLFMAVLGGVGHVWGAFLGARRGQAGRRPAAGAAAQTDRHQRQLRGHRLRHRAGAGAEVRARRAVELRGPALCHSPHGGRTGPTHRRCPRAASPQRGDLLLQVQAVRKEFGGLVAVNDISFDIRAGDIVGLIGPNGAGKSTTFNLITGVLGLTKGEVRFRGQPSAGCRRGRSPGAACRAPSST
jgi:branched-chain amino acid transport system permease protein